MVCFCDIPLSLNETHIRNFGGYGLGMSRRWGVENDINPVRYIRQGSTVAQLYKSLHTTDMEVMRHLAATVQNICYVDECEWRYVPQSGHGLHIPQFIVDTTLENPERLNYINERLECNRMLTFQSSDIECIVVESEDEINRLKCDIERQTSSSANHYQVMIHVDEDVLTQRLLYPTIIDSDILTLN